VVKGLLPSFRTLSNGHDPFCTIEQFRWHLWR
jgi:hypothetical protein